MAPSPWRGWLVAIVFIAAGLWLGSRSLTCFDDTGHWWRGRVRDTFVETSARVEQAYASRVVAAAKSTGRTIAVDILVVARYDVSGVQHRMVDVKETFGALYGAAFERAEAGARAFARTTPTVRVFYDPADPGYAVLTKDHVPGFLRGTVMSALGSVILLTGTTLVVFGIVSIVQSMAPTERWRYGVSVKRPTRVVDAAPLVEPTPEPAPPPSRPAALTGNSTTDYYSGAIRGHSLAHWSGFWCEIFLMPDNTVIVAHDESSHHYFRTWTLDDVIAGRSGIMFDENQQDERAAFDQRIRQQRGL